MPKPIKHKDYEHALEAMQIELIELQRWVKLRGKRLCVLFEGRDAAGKGGTIKALTEKLETRNYRIVALGKPGEAEQGQ
ncbi:Polyphosphate kinase 2 domain protein, partial [mine drainage metagenome]